MQDRKVESARRPSNIQIENMLRGSKTKIDSVIEPKDSATLHELAKREQFAKKLQKVRLLQEFSDS